MHRDIIISDCLLKMLLSGKGWRNHHGSSGVTELREVLTYETKELGNTDIFDFVQKNYVDNNFCQLDYEKIGIDKCIDDTVDYIRSLFTTDKNKKVNVVWLTDYQNVLDKYTYNESSIMLACVPIYKLDMLPISDLGCDGTLFATIKDLNFDDYILTDNTDDYNQINYCEYANSLRENAIKDENGNIICSPTLWENIATIIENI